MKTKVNPCMTNTQLSFNDRNIIIDYEYKLHTYSNIDRMKSEGLVPVEMYPYKDDILEGLIPVDDIFGVIKLDTLYKWVVENITKEQ